MFNQAYNVGDIVQVEIGNRTLIPRVVAKFIGDRGYVTGVKQGFDLYDNEKCIEKLNDQLIITDEIYDTVEPKAIYLFEGEYVYALVETIESGFKYKISLVCPRDKDADPEEKEVYYYVYRKAFYEIKFARVTAPLFKEAKKWLTYDYDISEEYLVKVGNKFSNDNAFIVPTFGQRLLNAIKRLFIKEKSLEEIMRENMKEVLDSLK